MFNMTLNSGLNDAASRNDRSKANQWEFEVLEFVNASDEAKPARQDLGWCNNNHNYDKHIRKNPPYNTQ